MRKASLVLSVAPFVVGLVLLSLLFSSYGLEGLTFLVALFFALPVLMTSSAVSVFLAFKKTEPSDLDSPAKVMSVISAAIFGPLGLFAIVSFVTVQAQYAEWL